MENNSKSKMAKRETEKDEEDEVLAKEDFASEGWKPKRKKRKFGITNRESRGR